MGNHHLVPFPQGDGDLSGIDLSLAGGFPAFDTDDPMSQYEFDPSLPSVLVDASNFDFASAGNVLFVDPSQLHTIPSDTTTPPVATPFVYAPQLVRTPQPPIPQPQPQPRLQASPPPPDLPAQQQQRIKKIASGFPCTHPGCGKVYDRACDLRKHVGRAHTPQDQRQRKCPLPACGKRFIWPKDVQRHLRQVHPEYVTPSSTERYPSTTALSEASSGSSGHSQPEKAVAARPAKRQRQIFAALPGKFSTALWFCRSVVLLKGLRLRSHSHSDAGDTGHDADADADAPGEIVDDEDEHAPPIPATTTVVPTGANPTPPTTIPPAMKTETSDEPHPHHHLRQHVPASVAPSPPKKLVMITRNRRDFRAVDVTGAHTATDVRGCIRRAAPAMKELEVVMSEFSLRDDGARSPLMDEALMTAVNERAGEGNGLMLLLTVVKS